MADRAQVTSIEYLEDFRNSLVVYLDKARRALDEISDEVTRTRVWLESDRRLHWGNQVKKRTWQLEQRKEELFSAQLGGMRTPSPQQQAAVRKARLAVEEAEDKFRRTKQWARQFDASVEPAAKEVDKLRNVLAHDMKKAMIFLDGAVDSLKDYAGIRALPAPSGESAPTQSAAGVDAAEPGDGGDAR